jgi:Family of unknown function (DUF6325)
MPTALQADSIGPVDVAVIQFEGDKFDSDVAPALADLSDSGTVRVIDLAFVRKQPDGATSFAEVGDEEVADAFNRVTDAQFDLLSDADLTEIAAGLTAGTSALVIVWENSWASRLASAVRASHGRLIAQERIPRENVVRAIAALDES